MPHRDPRTDDALAADLDATFRAQAWCLIGAGLIAFWLAIGLLVAHFGGRL